MDQTAHLNYRFGNFEVRLESATLLENGVPIAIQKLPFLMLVALLEQPHRTVSRVTLQKRLWGDQNYLQFENGIHVAAAKLREALGDNTADPRFIRTIPRHGYQFVAEDLIVVNLWENSLASTETIPSASTSYEDIPAKLLRITTQLRDPGRYAERLMKLSKIPTFRIAALSVMTLCSLAAAGVFAYRGEHNTRTAPGETVMLGSFSNKTGDVMLDGVYDFPFHSKMRESRYLHFAESDAPSATFDRLIPISISDELVQCRTAKANFLVTGQLEKQTTQYTVRLSLWKCVNNRLMATESAYAGNPTEIFRALDTVSTDLRAAFGEPKQSIDQLDAHANQSPTASIAALRAFNFGESKRNPATVDIAISYYKLATDLDPLFAVAFDRLGMSYNWTGDTTLSKKAFSEAFRLRDRATDRERLSINSHYYDVVTGETPQAVQTYKLWINMFPYDNDPLNSLSANYLDNMGQPAMALELEEKAIVINPNSVPANVNLAQAHFELGDFNYLEKYCQNLSLPASKTGSIRVLCYLKSFAQGDEAGMQLEVGRTQSSFNTARLLSQAAMVAFYRGQITEAINLSMQSRKRLLASHSPEFCAWVEIEQALMETALGMNDRSKTDALDAVQLDAANPETLGMAALVLSSVGDRSEAESLERRATLLAPLNTQVNVVDLGIAHALSSLSANNSQDAIQSLDDERVYDFGGHTLLAPAYYRGLALENEHDWRAAASQFQLVINHRNIIPDSPFVALATLELGHALKESGDEVHAASSFHELEIIWAHADRQFGPMQRLSEYERMHLTKP